MVFWYLSVLFYHINLTQQCLTLGGSEVKTSAWNAGDPGSIPGSGRSPGEGNGNPLQYSCLENPMEGGAWWATVHGVAKSRTRLSDLTSLHFILCLTVCLGFSFFSPCLFFLFCLHFKYKDFCYLWLLSSHKRTSHF